MLAWKKISLTKRDIHHDPMMVIVFALIYQERSLKDDLKSFDHPINDGRHISQGQDGH